MGTEIQTDGDFSAVASAIIMPAPGLTNFHTFGGSAAAGRVNYAEPAAPLVAIGAPIVHSSYITADSGANMYQTGRPETLDMTVFAVARISEGSAVFSRILSNAASTGLSFYFDPNNGGRLLVSAAYEDEPTMNRSFGITTGYDVTKWGLLWCRIRSGIGIDLKSETTGQGGFYAKTPAHIPNASTTLRIGGRPALTPDANQVDIAHVSFAPYAMTDVQIAAQVAFIRSEMTYQAAPIPV